MPRMARCQVACQAAACVRSARLLPSAPAVDFSRIAAGDQAAFEQVFKAHYRPLCAFALQYVKDGDRAQDLVQELFARLWQDRERTTVTTSLKSYLFAAVRNRCLNAI